MVSNSAQQAIERDEAVQRRRRRIMFIAGGVAVVLLAGAFVANRLFGASCDADTTDQTSGLCYTLPEGWAKLPKDTNADTTAYGDGDGDGLTPKAESVAFRLADPTHEVTDPEVAAGFILGSLGRFAAPETMTVSGHRAATVSGRVDGFGGWSMNGVQLDVGGLNDGAYARVTVVELEPGMFTVLFTVVGDTPDQRTAADAQHQSLDVYE